MVRVVECITEDETQQPEQLDHFGISPNPHHHSFAPKELNKKLGQAPFSDKAQTWRFPEIAV